MKNRGGSSPSGKAEMLGLKRTIISALHDGNPNGRGMTADALAPKTSKSKAASLNAAALSQSAKQINPGLTVSLDGDLLGKLKRARTAKECRIQADPTGAAARA